MRKVEPVDVKSTNAKQRVLGGNSSCCNEYLVLGKLELSCRKNPKLVHKHGFCEILTYVYMSDCYDI